MMIIFKKKEITFGDLSIDDRFTDYQAPKGGIYRKIRPVSNGFEETNAVGKETLVFFSKDNIIEPVGNKKYHELRTGDTFIYEGRTFIRVPGEEKLSCDLLSGIHQNFLRDTTVRVVDIKLEVVNKEVL